MSASALVLPVAPHLTAPALLSALRSHSAALREWLRAHSYKVSPDARCDALTLDAVSATAEPGRYLLAYTLHWSSQSACSDQSFACTESEHTTFGYSANTVTFESAPTERDPREEF
jgi:hypothetical protein